MKPMPLSKLLTAICFCISLGFANAQQMNTSAETLSLLFIGDVMGHGPQIKSAWVDSTESYDYNGVFAPLKKVMQNRDFAVANLEVTLAGPPFDGYPQFSSPDALAEGLRNNGVDVLVTANNHSCDRRLNGVVRTIEVLDSYNILHTGTFLNQEHRDSTNLLILKKGSFRIGLLNYTYGTNGLPTPAPTIVNRIDTALIASDIAMSKSDSLDKLIVFIHWGKEYQLHPSDEQINLGQFLFDKGVDIVIGSHPHVIQRMELHRDTVNFKDKFIAYSLGNFVSNQRDTYRDGGAMVEISLTKNGTTTTIDNAGYLLTWVHRPTINNKVFYEVLPCSLIEQNAFQDIQEAEKMKIYMELAREHFDAENIGVKELSH